MEGGTDPAIYDLDNDWVIDLAIPVGANGLADALETSPDSGVHIINPPRDTDGDGVNDYHDLDSEYVDAASESFSEPSDHNLGGLSCECVLLLTV